MTKTADILFILVAIIIVLFAAYYSGNLFFGNTSSFSTTTPSGGYSPGSGVAPAPTSIPVGGGSPYLGKVSIGWVSPHVPGVTNKKYGEVTIYTHGLAQGEKVDITGWAIKANSGNRFIIPTGSAFYHSSSSPVYGDIILDSNDQVHIYSNAPPYPANFRLNKCIGYQQGFEPQHYSQCPRVEKEDISHLLGACQNYLLKLNSCEVGLPLPNELRYAYDCYAAAATLTYETCYERHKNDSNFFSNEWRIWLGNPNTNIQVNIFDPYHDRVQLLDREGRLVDEYTY